MSKDKRFNKLGEEIKTTTMNLPLVTIRDARRIAKKELHSSNVTGLFCHWIAEYMDKNSDEMDKLYPEK